jgi:hypothetical protein
LNAQSGLTSLAIVFSAVVLGFAGATVGHILGAGGLVASALTALAVVLLFTFRPISGLAAFGVVLLLSQSVTHWTGTELRYVDELALAGLVLATIAVHRRQLERPRLGAAEIGLAALVAGGIASSLLAGVPPGVAGPGLALMLKGFAFFYLVQALRVTGDDLRLLSRTFLVVALAIGAIGLVQLLAPVFADDVLRLPGTGRQRGGIDVIGSVFTHPALFGWLTAFISLFLYARFAIRRDWWSIALALTLNAGTLLSGRRAPVIGVLVALAVGGTRLFAAGRVPRRAWAALGGAALILLVASIALLGDFYRSTLDNYGAPPAVIAEVFAEEPDPRVVSELHPRVALYAGSLAIARDEFPFGVGTGRYASHMSRETYSPAYEAYGLQRTYGLRQRNPIAVTDTFWPMILGETGVIGLVGALVFFGGVGVRLWRAAQRNGDSEIHLFALGALLVYVETLVRSLVSPVFVAPPIAYFAFGAIGLALAANRRRRRPAPGAVQD